MVRVASRAQIGWSENPKKIIILNFWLNISLSLHEDVANTLLLDIFRIVLSSSGARSDCGYAYEICNDLFLSRFRGFCGLNAYLWLFFLHTDGREAYFLYSMIRDEGGAQWRRELHTSCCSQ